MQEVITKTLEALQAEQSCPAMLFHVVIVIADALAYGRDFVWLSASRLWPVRYKKLVRLTD